MARAKTMESVREAAGGGNGPLSRHNTCRMELPRPFHTWPSLLSTATAAAAGTTGSGPGAVHLHHHNHHHLPLCLSYPLPGEAQTHQRLPAASPLCNRREETGGGTATPSASSEEEEQQQEEEEEEESDSDGEERRQACTQRGPLPDLLPQNEHPAWSSPRHRAPGGEAAQRLEVRRVAGRLRVIGDEFNATVLRRAHAAPHWQDWRDACRGLLNFITQTLSTLYRLT